jgi:hypothetical protein
MLKPAFALIWSSRGASDAQAALAIRRARLNLSPWQWRLCGEIDLLLEDRPDPRWWHSYRELAVLPTLLDEGEELFDLSGARFGWVAGLVALTSTRLLFLGYRLLIPTLKVKSFPLANLADHKVRRQGKRYARLVLKVDRAATPAELHGMQPGDAERFNLALTQAQTSRSRTP